ncbi:hypothetical protein [Hymenobacter siberiensis]|uniref:hypothetical protein n=1 Tax=Hymenobacter siberiensis TaxID=2848396 RepID=UPI001C1E3825|nr:hypothetical protein [Hymenobacter siberiensis]MBU6121710.1 hypothetical protein [Hymenobacter siberiensis]
MLYIIWELLNLVALGLLLWASYKAVKILAREWGILKTGLFTLLLLAMTGGKQKASVPMRTAVSNTNALRPGIYLPVISDKFINRLSLVIIKSSGTDTTAATVAQDFSGLGVGHKWEPIGPGIYRFQHGQLAYNIPQLLRWNLLGINVFTQLKQLKGTTTLHN